MNLNARSVTSAELLASPRGREFLVDLVTHISGVPWRATSDAESTTALQRAARVLGSGHEIGTALWDALRECTSSSCYWDAPPDRSSGLAAPRYRKPLGELADAALPRYWPAWWSSSYDGGSQVFIAPMEANDSPDPSPPKLTGTADHLARWASSQRKPAAPVHPWDGPSVWDRRTGDWWSTPAVYATTRTNPDLGVVGLMLYEDVRTWRRAATWPVRTRDGASIYEVRDAASWLGLLGQSAIDVTDHVQYDWYRASGVRGRWEIPDWEELAQRYDAIHLTIDGYLRLAGNPIDTGRGTLTMVAGWAPDETYWLTDSFTVVGPSTVWVAYGHDEWRLEST